MEVNLNLQSCILTLVPTGRMHLNYQLLKWSLDWVPWSTKTPSEAILIVQIVPLHSEAIQALCVPKSSTSLWVICKTNTPRSLFPHNDEAPQKSQTCINTHTMCTVIHRPSWSIRFDISVKYVKMYDEKLLNFKKMNFKLELEPYRNAAVVTELLYTKAGGGGKWVNCCSS